MFMTWSNILFYLPLQYIILYNIFNSYVGNTNYKSTRILNKQIISIQKIVVNWVQTQWNAANS